MPPPIRRKSTSRSGHRLACRCRCRARRAPSGRPPCPGRARPAPRRPPPARCRRSGTKPLPSRRTEISRLPSGIGRSPTRRPVTPESLAEQHLDDLQLLLLQVEQVDEAVLGHLVLEQAQDQVGRRDRGLDPEQVEVLAVARVVDPGDDLVDQVLLAARPGRSACCPRRRRSPRSPCRRAGSRPAPAPRARRRRRRRRCARAPARPSGSGAGCSRSASPRAPSRAARGPGSSRPCRRRRR